MKKILVFILLIATEIVASYAAPLTGKQKEAVVAKINKTAAAMKSMSCQFTQTKTVSLLKNTMVSKGTMQYQQPDKLRWAYTSPYKYLFIFNGTKVYVANKSKKDVIDTQTNKMFKEIARIMMSTVTGKALSNAADFDVVVNDNKTTYNVMLTPKKKELKQMFQKVELIFSKSNSMISEINIFEKKNNDKTNIKFSNISINSKINESSFAIPK